jgi:hypothetical protein
MGYLGRRGWIFTILQKDKMDFIFTERFFIEIEDLHGIYGSHLLVNVFFRIKSIIEWLNTTSRVPYKFVVPGPLLNYSAKLS